MIKIEYPQHMFLWKTVEKYPLIITKYPLCLSDPILGYYIVLPLLFLTASILNFIFFLEMYCFQEINPNFK